MPNLRYVLPLLVALPLPAQTLLHSHTLPFLGPVNRMGPAGDTNNDGIVDVVVLATNQNDPQNWPQTMLVLSGSTGAPLFSIVDAALANATDVFGCGDVTGDGRSDLVAGYYDKVRVYSGSNGALVYQLSPSSSNESFRGFAPVGDYDGNGRADLAIVSFDSTTGSAPLRIRRGETGALLATVAMLTGSGTGAAVRAVGDLTGDGKQELAIAFENGDLAMRNGATGSVLWSQTIQGSDSNRSLEAIDLDGDGRRELFHIRPGFQPIGVQGRITVHAPTTGAVLLTLQGAPGAGLGGPVAPAGDLDQDGRQDFLVANLGLSARSGTDGRRMWPLASWVPGSGLGSWVGVGDTNGDGFGEFVAAMVSNYQPAILHQMTARVLAEATPVQPACGGGPFLPRLGSTRPILGQPLTIAGQDNPPTVPGVLVLSFGSAPSTWLGASTCYAHFDLAAGIALAPLAQAQWSLTVPLPLVPQLAGFEFMLQSWHSGTAGPLGYDLSNGMRGRFGHP